MSIVKSYKESLEKTYLDQEIKKITTNKTYLSKRIEQANKLFPWFPPLNIEEISPQVFRFLIKSCSKTGVDEKAQFLALKNKLPNATLLPKAGKNAYYVSTRGIIQGVKQFNNTKSLDVKHNETFFILKFLRHSGGTQESQLYEAINTINMFYTEKQKQELVFIIDSDQNKIPQNKLIHKIKCSALNKLLYDKVFTSMENFFINKPLLDHFIMYE